MKRNLILLGLGIFWVQTTLAETTIPWTKAGCESVKGVWVMAHSATDEGCDANHCNGKTFCGSPGTPGVNWFSAVIWCQSIGRELTSLEDTCPNSFASGGGCPNLPRGPGYWTSTRSASGKPYVIKHDRTAFVEENPVRKDSLPAALCK